MSLNLDFNSTEYQGKEEINLINKQITSLPESIGNLNNLQNLFLDNNQLTSLPESIGNLNNLQVLSMSNNQLTSLPESIGNLNNLQLLSLMNNQLTSLPDSFGDLKNLQSLLLMNNQLTSLPESFGDLKNLQSLLLMNNQLTYLPESIGNLVNLKNLYLGNNQLTSLPESIGNLVNLTDLTLQYNQLTYLPEGIGNLKSLEELNLTNNQLTSLPESIGNLKINLLNLENNPQLTSLPESIVNLNPFRTTTVMIIIDYNVRVPEILANSRKFNIVRRPLPRHRPQQIRVDATQIHKFTAKINFDYLISFFKSKTGNVEIPSDINYPNFIKQSLVTFINHSKESEEEKNKKKEGLERIMNERLRGLNYSLNSPLLNKTVFYVLLYVDSQPEDLKNAYVDTFIKECIHAYEGEYGMTCAQGALERIILSLQSAIVTYGIEKNPDYQTIIDIINTNPEKLVSEYIKDWYKLHKTGTKDGFTEIDTPEYRRANLKEYLKMKLSGQSDEWIEGKIKDIADHIGYDDDDFMYGGRRRPRRKTKKLRKTTKTKKLRKQKKTKKRKPKVKRARGRTKKIKLQ